MKDTAQTQEGISYETKTLITIILLVFVYPVGLILMFVWMKWKWWVKALVGFPLLLVPIALLGIIAVVILATINPKAQIEKANQVRMEQENRILMQISPTVRMKK